MDRKPDVVIHLGDHWDMPSLSSYAGALEQEGRRYQADVEKGNDDLALLTAPLRRSRSSYSPRLVLLRGNHENRIERALQDSPRLVGAIGYDDLESPEWEVHDFLKPVWIDGVAYCHYFANPMTGRPYGGLVTTRLKTIGHSFTMGHVQTLDTGMIPVLGPTGPVFRRGLVAGSCYLSDEDYKGYQGNAHWRGVLVCHEVHDGTYDLMEVSLDYLCRKYEGVSVGEFLRSNYPEMTGTLWV